MPCYTSIADSNVNFNKILFIHIPKTGGTSIESHLRSTGKYTETLFTPAGTPLSERLDFSDCNLKKIHSQHQSFNTILNHEKQLDVKINEVDLFLSVVRNPYNRAISELFWRKNAVPTDSVDVINNQLRILLKAPNWGAYHIFPQYVFLLNQQNIIDDRFIVLKTEALTDSLTQLGCVFSTFNRFWNRSHSVKRQGESQDYFNFLDGESIKIINDLYHDDFTLFGYDKL